LLVVNLSINENEGITLDELLKFNHFIYDIDDKVFKYFKQALLTQNMAAESFLELITGYKIMCFSDIKIVPQTFNKLEAQEMIFKLSNFVKWHETFYQGNYFERSVKKNFMDVGDTIYYGFSKSGGALITVKYPTLNDIEEKKLNKIINNYQNIDFYIFILALHQKVSLASFSHRLFELNIKNKWQGISRLRAYLNNFIAEVYFSQITTNEIGTEFYHKWRSIFEVDELYKEVCDQLKSVDEFNKSKASNIVGKWSYIVFPILTINSLIAFYNSISGLSNSLSISIYTIFSAAGLLAILFFTINKLLKHGKFKC